MVCSVRDGCKSKALLRTVYHFLHAYTKRISKPSLPISVPHALGRPVGQPVQRSAGHLGLPVALPLVRRSA